jgi:hypothetical protein
MNQPTKQCLTIKHLIILVIFSDFKDSTLDFHIRLYKPYTFEKPVKKSFQPVQ